MIHNAKKLTNLWEMQRIEAHKVIAAYAVLKTTAKTATPQGWKNPETTKLFTQMLDDMKAHLQPLDLRVSLHLVENLAVVVNVGPQLDATHALGDEVSRRLTELESCIQKELEDCAFYSLTKGEAKCIGRGANLFGEQVVLRLPRARYDLGEAARCMGFGCHTAAIFHMMRAMEHGVSAAVSALGANPYNRHDKFIGWAAAITKIRNKAQDLPDKERKQWLCIADMIYTAKECWRNDTMHIVATYSQAEATETYEAVRVFMRHLAAQLPEDETEKIKQFSEGLQRETQEAAQ